MNGMGLTPESFLTIRLRRMKVIAPGIQNLKKLIENAETLQREFNTLRQEITDYLSKHDLATSGNTGWEYRLFNLLYAFMDEVDRTHER